MMDIKKLINPGLLNLSPYKPGKPVEDLERELGIKNAIKLASNENPMGPSPLALKAVDNLLSGLHRYPDGNALRLKESISNEYNVDIDQITVGNGSNDIIEFAVRSFLSSKDSAVFSEHAFAVYPLAVQMAGAEGIEVPAVNWGHDLEAMLGAVKENTKLVFIANPNNPTGTFISRDKIISFLDAISSDVIVFLDQAYFDYASYENNDVDFEFVEEFPNLIISRSFSKAYGLAGFRIGYSVSSKVIQLGKLLFSFRFARFSGSAFNLHFKRLISLSCSAFVKFTCFIIVCFFVEANTFFIAVLAFFT
jgi:histidinol-phosphate aminotransferase